MTEKCPKRGSENTDWWIDEKYYLLISLFIGVSLGLLLSIVLFPMQDCPEITYFKESDIFLSKREGKVLNTAKLSINGDWETGVIVRGKTVSINGNRYIMYEKTKKSESD